MSAWLTRAGTVWSLTRTSTRTRLALAAVLSTLLLGGTAASAATSAAATSITACVNAKTGAVRVPAAGTHCITTGAAGKRERALAWSQQGPAGARGATGATGAQGADGHDGATGPAGEDGHDGTNGAQGATGARGQAGTDGGTGARGPEGVAGPAGAPGTLVTKTVSLHGTQAMYDQSDWYEAMTNTVVGGWRVWGHCVGYAQTDEAHRDYVEADWVGADPGSATPVVLSPIRDFQESNRSRPTAYLAAGRDTRTLQVVFSDGSNPLTVTVSRVRNNDDCLMAMTVSAGS